MKINSSLYYMVYFLFLAPSCGFFAADDHAEENVEAISSGMNESLAELKNSGEGVTEDEIVKQESKIEEYEEELRKSPTIKKSKQEKSELILSLVESYLKSGDKAISDSILTLFLYPDIVDLYDSDPSFQKKMDPYFEAKEDNGH